MNPKINLIFSLETFVPSIFSICALLCIMDVVPKNCVKWVFIDQISFLVGRPPI